MSASIRKSLLACAVIGLAFGITTSPVRADDQENMIRAAQQNLATMGYFIGEYDGEINGATKAALRDFQLRNGLAASGELTPETYALLGDARYVRTGYNGFYDGRYVRNAYYPIAYNDRVGNFAPILDTTMVTWNDRWYNVSTQNIPTRFGKMDLTEEVRGGLRHFAVTLNGRPVLMAQNQPGVIRVSQTYKLDGEDAVLFTAYNGESECAYKTYMVTVKVDGTTAGPRLLGNCNSSLQARVANNALFVSFPNDLIGNGWGTYDTFRYENGALVRL